MSGGSSGGKKTEKKKDEPAIPGTGPMMSQPAFMGDNQSLLAQQLAAGGYGSMPDIMQMLTQTFTPMQVLNTQPGATPTPAPTPTPTPTPVQTPRPTRPNRPTLPDRNHNGQLGARGNIMDHYRGGRDG
jgi:hypothetical protein